jgi:hypothetical protein
MMRLRRFVAICILTTTLFGAVAKAGDVLTPPLPPPTPSAEPQSDCSGTEGSTLPDPEHNLVADIATTARMFAAWFAISSV